MSYHVDKSMNLPKKYFSYSQYDLWKKSKSEYRLKYYEGKESFETVETIFGKKIAKMLEDDAVVAAHPVLSKVPRYSKPEYDIQVEVEGIPIRGFIDTFEESDCSFLDYKSGHLSKDGKIPWDAVKVAKHEQLPFYSVLLKEKHGKVNRKTGIVWLETAFKNKTVDFDGHKLSAETRELELTGKYETFYRIIPQWELKIMREKIVKAAYEISEDYTKYKHEHINNQQVVQ